MTASEAAAMATTEATVVAAAEAKGNGRSTVAVATVIAWPVVVVARPISIAWCGVNAWAGAVAAAVAIAAKGEAQVADFGSICGQTHNQTTKQTVVL